MNLTHISIKRIDNYVHDDEAAVLGEALKENTTLTTLNLSSESTITARVCLYEHQNYHWSNNTENYLGREGAIALCRFLETNTTLTELNLEGLRLPLFSQQ